MHHTGVIARGVALAWGMLDSCISCMNSYLHDTTCSWMMQVRFRESLDISIEGIDVEEGICVIPHRPEGVVSSRGYNDYRSVEL